MENNDQQGNTLIEVIAVIGIIGTLSVGIYAGLSNINARVRIEKGYEETVRIVHAMRDYFSAFHPTDTSAEKLEKMGIFTNSYEDAADHKKYYNNALGIKTEVQLSGTASGQYNDSFFALNDSPTFRVIYHAVDPKICIGLLTANWGKDEGNGLVEIKAGSKVFRWKKDDASKTPLPPELDEAVSACSAEETTIYWEYFF